MARFQICSFLDRKGKKRGYPHRCVCGGGGGLLSVLTHGYQ